MFKNLTLTHIMWLTVCFVLIFLQSSNIIYAYTISIKPLISRPAYSNGQFELLRNFGPEPRRQQEILFIYKTIFHLSYEISPEIMTARANLEKSKHQYFTARSERFSPSIDLRISQIFDPNNEDVTDTTSTQNNSETNTSAQHTDGDQYTDWTVNMDLPIFRKSLSLEQDIAQQELELANINLKIKTHELAINLEKLLGNYLVASYQLLNLKNSITLSKNHLNKIVRGYELRDQTRLQLLRAEANTKELESRLDLLKHNKDRSFFDLLDVSGINKETPLFIQLEEILKSEEKTSLCISELADTQNKYQVLAGIVEKSSVDDIRLHFLDTSLISRRITLEYQLRKIKSEQFTEDEWPDLSISGNYERKADTRFSDFDSQGNLSLMLTVPLFSGGTLLSNTKIKNQAQQIAAIKHNSMLRKNIHSLLNNKDLIKRMLNIFSIQQTHLQQQQEIVTLSLKSYKIKQTSMQDLLSSQNRLIGAKNALMETTNNLGILLNQFAWELNIPLPNQLNLQIVD